MLDAVYDTSVASDETWLAQVVAAFEAHIVKRATAGYFVEAPSAPAFRAWGFQSRSEALSRSFEHWQKTIDPRIAHLTHTALVTEYVSQARLPSLEREATAAARELDIELLGLNAVDVTGSGLSIVALCEERARAPLDARSRAILERLGAHLAQALRLRRRLRVGRAPVEAELRADGHLLSVDGEAREDLAMKLLRNAASGRTSARRNVQRLSGSDVTRAWSALVGGKWSLLDARTEAGSLVLLARRNAPEPAPVPELTTREREILGGLAMGHSNKLIAYELGAAPSTIAWHITRLAAKLGTPTRPALIKRAKELMR